MSGEGVQTAWAGARWWRSRRRRWGARRGRLSPEPQRFVAELRALRRECWLRGAVPIVARLDALARREVQPGERFVDIAEALESPGAVRGPAVVTVTAGAELPDFRRRVVRVRLDPPGATARERIWARALAVAPSSSSAAGEVGATGRGAGDAAGETAGAVGRAPGGRAARGGSPLRQDPARDPARRRQCPPVHRRQHAADVDVARLADGYEEMCGGNIRNAVLRAAFLAAAEGTQITHQHMVRAARAEYRAMGKVL